MGSNMGIVKISMNNTLGAAFIGNIVGAVQVIFLLLKIHIGNGSNHDVVLLFSLFGITTLQAFIYFKGNPQDRWPFKLLVRKTLCMHAFHLKDVEKS
jgi:hypothetical protein